jgi:osmoprotectant transport system permease protein
MIAAFDWVRDNQQVFFDALLRHLVMCGLSLLIAVLIAIPIGIAVAGSSRATFVATNLANFLRTIPSLVILAAAMPYFGIGLLPSVIALVILSVPPILLNTSIGIAEVDFDLIDAARGMGMTRLQILMRVQLRLAAPAILTGLRTSTVQVIGGAALASFIGGGGLGDFVTIGIAIMDVPRLLVGALPIALMAIIAEVLFAGLQRALLKHRKLLA